MLRFFLNIENYACPQGSVDLYGLLDLPFNASERDVEDAFFANLTQMNIQVPRELLNTRKVSPLGAAVMGVHGGAGDDDSTASDEADDFDDDGTGTSSHTSRTRDKSSKQQRKEEQQQQSQQPPPPRGRRARGGNGNNSDSDDGDNHNGATRDIPLESLDAAAVAKADLHNQRSNNRGGAAEPFGDVVVSNSDDDDDVDVSQYGQRKASPQRGARAPTDGSPASNRGAVWGTAAVQKSTKEPASPDVAADEKALVATAIVTAQAQQQDKAKNKFNPVLHTRRLQDTFWAFKILTDSFELRQVYDRCGVTGLQMLEWNNTMSEDYWFSPFIGLLMLGKYSVAAIATIRAVAVFTIIVFLGLLVERLEYEFPFDPPTTAAPSLLFLVNGSLAPAPTPQPLSLPPASPSPPTPAPPGPLPFNPSDPLAKQVADYLSMLQRAFSTPQPRAINVSQLIDNITTAFADSFSPTTPAPPPPDGTFRSWPLVFAPLILINIVVAFLFLLSLGKAVHVAWRVSRDAVKTRKGAAVRSTCRTFFAVLGAFLRKRFNFLKMMMPIFAVGFILAILGKLDGRISSWNLAAIPYWLLISSSAIARFVQFIDTFVYPITIRKEATVERVASVLEANARIPIIPWHERQTRYEILGMLRCMRRLNPFFVPHYTRVLAKRRVFAGRGGGRARSRQQQQQQQRAPQAQPGQTTISIADDKDLVIIKSKYAKGNNDVFWMTIANGTHFLFVFAEILCPLFFSAFAVSELRDVEKAREHNDRIIDMAIKSALRGDGLPGFPRGSFWGDFLNSTVGSSVVVSPPTTWQSLLIDVPTPRWGALLIAVLSYASMWGAMLLFDHMWHEYQRMKIQHARVREVMHTHYGNKSPIVAAGEAEAENHQQQQQQQEQQRGARNEKRSGKGGQRRRQSPSPKGGGLGLRKDQLEMRTIVEEQNAAMIQGLALTFVKCTLMICCIVAFIVLLRDKVMDHNSRSFRTVFAPLFVVLAFSMVAAIASAVWAIAVRRTCPMDGHKGGGGRAPIAEVIEVGGSGAPSPASFTAVPVAADGSRAASKRPLRRNPSEPEIQQQQRRAAQPADVQPQSQAEERVMPWRRTPAFNPPRPAIATSPPRTASGAAAQQQRSMNVADIAVGARLEAASRSRDEDEISSMIARMREMQRAAPGGADANKPGGGRVRRGYR